MRRRPRAPPTKRATRRPGPQKAPITSRLHHDDSHVLWGHDHATGRPYTSDKTTLSHTVYIRPPLSHDVGVAIVLQPCSSMLPKRQRQIGEEAARLTWDDAPSLGRAAQLVKHHRSGQLPHDADCKVHHVEPSSSQGCGVGEEGVLVTTPQHPRGVSKRKRIIREKRQDQEQGRGGGRGANPALTSRTTMVPS